MTAAAAPGSEVSEFEASYAENFSLVWGALRRFGVPSWLLEDAAQEVFLVWYRQREQFRGEAQVASYLYAIARRVAANVRRTAWRTERRHQALAHRVEAPSPTPEEDLSQRQTAAAFHRAVAGLPSKLREVYLLAIQDGLTAQQIGLALGVSANTVSSRIRLTRARLAAELRVELAGGEAPPAGARQRVWAVLMPLLAPVASAGPGRAALLLLGVTVVLAGVIGVAATRSRDEGGAPRVVTAAASRPAAVIVAPITAPPRVSAPPVVARREASPPGPRGPGDPLAREAKLLAEAQTRLRDGDPEGALIHLRAHAARFTDGVLAQERDALIAAALCQRGDFAAGRAAALELVARAPRSPALATASAACAADPEAAGGASAQKIGPE